MDKSSPFYAQVALLVRVVPLLAHYDCFALKGGTAINLFVRDLPRLSVDIDLVYLPVNTREEALADIGSRLDQMEIELKATFPGMQIQRPAQQTSDSQRLTLRYQGVQIKIELSPVLRGTVWPAAMLSVSEAVEAEFGYAEVPVVSLNDLYAGKIMAALDRQHPRDLFDILLLLQHEGMSRDLFRTFLVYLVSHGRPMAELLSPTRKDIAALYDAEFRTMTSEPVPQQALLETRERLIATLHDMMSEDDRAFLLSVKGKEPEWALLGFDGIGDLPAVKWKLQNLEKMDEEKHAAAYARLEETLKKEAW